MTVRIITDSASDITAAEIAAAAMYISARLCYNQSSSASRK